MEPIYLPEHVDIEEEATNVATFAIHPYHPGYGPTVGNALRRVLLSSLPGCAITHMKIDGVDHEYSSMDGVKEDLISLMLQLKKVRLSSTSEEPIEIVLEGSGEGQLTAGDFKTPPEVTIANPDLPIAMLTDSKAKITLRCTVEQGRGYIPAETRDKEQRDIGTVALDAIFTPVERVSFKIENVRVGKETDHHKLLLTIATDGTKEPIAVLKEAASVLADHFAELSGDFEEKLTADRPEEEPEIEIEPEPAEPENTLSLLQLPSRVHNALERMGITTVEQVVELSEEQIQDIPGLGQKAVEDIMKARDAYIAANPGEATTETVESA
ncbi:DNA-directed RNA polymerase subunit alpha [bacterium]|nr:DNA-directed RNA polymerase subunit alpha [bacterium]